jgi:hypothetical protein
MAIHPSIQGLSATVRVAYQGLPEFDYDGESDIGQTSTVTKYIKTKPGEQFDIMIEASPQCGLTSKLANRYPDILAKVDIDGQRPAYCGVYTIPTNGRIHWSIDRSIVEQKGTYRKRHWIFKDLQLGSRR